MFTSTISLRRVNPLFQETEGSRNTDADLAIQSVPELRTLKGKIPEEQLYARARAIAKIDAAIKDPSAAFGKAKVLLRGPSTNEIVQNLRDIRSMLVTESSPQAIAAKTVNTYFQGWDAPGDSNFGTFRQSMTVRVFLQRFLSDSEIVTDIFHVREQVSTPENPEVIHQVSRCKRFILALEARNPDAEYKPMFRRAMAALSNNDIRGARTILEETLKDEWNIDFDVVIASEEGMSRSLRAIGDTQGAAKTMAQEGAKTLKESRDLSPKQQALLSTIQSEFEAKKAAKMAIAQTLYNQTIEALPDNDPQRIKFQSQKSGMIDELASEQAYMGIMDGFIKENGPDGLGKMFQDYDEMRGLYGSLNFTDENAKIATESAMMVASFALTAGLGPILAGIAAGSRVLAGSRLLTAAQVSEKASRARKVATSVGNAAKAGTRAGLEVIAKGATAGAAADKAVESSKRAQALGQAAKFTTADAILRSITRSEGEKSSLEFETFFKNLATNAVMFKAFAAVEGLLNVQVLNRIKGKFGLQNSTKTYMLADFPILTAGDIAVMQAMHAAETGNLEFDMLGALQGMAFRIGFRGTESLIKTFPNLSAQFKAKYGDIRERVRLKRPVKELVPEGTFHSGDDMAYGAKLEPHGKTVLRQGDRTIESGTTPKRGVNIGDLHGEWVAFEGNLKSAKLIDDAGNWTGGDTHITFHGDILGDRGAHSVKIVKELMALREKARAAGGDITVLMGNHDGFVLEFLLNRGMYGPYHTFDDAFKDQANGIKELIDLYSPGNPKISGPDLLGAMRKHPEGKKLLEHIAQFDIFTMRGTELHTHTPLPDSVIEQILQYATDKGLQGRAVVDVLNKEWKDTMRRNLVEGKSKRGDKSIIDSLSSLFDTGNSYGHRGGEGDKIVNPNNPKTIDLHKRLAGLLGIDTIIHGHESSSARSIGGIEVSSVDNGYGKHGNTDGPTSVRDVTYTQPDVVVDVPVVASEGVAPEGPTNTSKRNHFREQVQGQPLRLEWNGKRESGFSPDITPEFFRGVRELVGKPHADFLSSIHNTLNRGQLPQFPGRDGFIWTIRKIESGPNGREKITVGKLGSMEEVIITAKELKDIINTNIRKYAELEKSNGKSADVMSPSEGRPKKNQVTDAFIETQVLQNNQERFLGRIRAGIKEGNYMEFPGPDGFIWTIRSIGRGTDPILTVGKKDNKTVQDVKASDLRKAINDQIKMYRESAKGVAVLGVVDVSGVTSQPKPETPPIYDANSGIIDRGAQSRIDAEHGIGRDTKSAMDSAQVFDAATMGPPTRETVMRQNIEQSIAKTRTDIDKLKKELHDMENSTGEYEGVAPQDDIIAKTRTDIARAEKHLTSLERSARELTPLRQSRRETQEHLRAERQKLIDMTPEGRAAELARVQTEGKELVGRKGDLEKKLEADKDKITWDERRTIEKDIEELSKKIDANKRQENMVKRADTITTKLREQGLDPAATTAALKDPTKRKALGDWLDNLKKNDKTKWAIIAVAVITLALLLWPRDGEDSAQEDSALAPSSDVPMADQLDALCYDRPVVTQMSGIQLNRKNSKGDILTDDLRKQISMRWIKNSPQWKSLIRAVDNNKSILEGTDFMDAFTDMTKNPTHILVQDIQNWVGMIPEDTKVGQDGILGPNTTKAILEFIEKCRDKKSVPSKP